MGRLCILVNLSIQIVCRLQQNTENSLDLLVLACNLSIGKVEAEEFRANLSHIRGHIQNQNMKTTHFFCIALAFYFCIALILRSMIKLY